MKRESGVLMPIFTLPGEFGCGSFGKEAKAWIDHLSANGFTWWQILPLGKTDSYHSPYASLSSFGMDPMWLDLEVLYKEGLIDLNELNAQKINSPYNCAYERIDKIRMPLLKKAAKRVKDREKVLRFLEENEILSNACRFFALRDLNDGKPCVEWTVLTPDEETLFAWQFIQYECHRQWHELRAYALTQGVKIMGDLPFYVSMNSFDVWNAPDLFCLDERKKPTAVAGVPPDYFNQDGQLWGNPLYDWERMKKDGFAYWKQRLSYSLSLFDGVRIDHFRALSAYWRRNGKKRFLGQRSR